MKITTKMSRITNQLEKMFNTINTDFFEGKLPQTIITVQSSKASYGHSTTSKVWKSRSDKESKYEINISAEYISMPIECTIDTMIHEMIHLYCRENNIQECSRNGKYHNKKFKELAEKCGLKVYKTNTYGYNTTHEGNDKLTEYAIEKGWTEIEYGRINNKWKHSPISNNNNEINNGDKNPTSSTIKYQCKKCGYKIRATKNMDNLIFCKCGETYTRY